MTFPVVVNSMNSQFQAALLGAPDVCAIAPTREGALAALEATIAKRLDRGELVALEVRRRGLAGLLGRYRDDPTLHEIGDTAHLERASTAKAVSFTELRRFLGGLEFAEKRAESAWVFHHETEGLIVFRLYDDEESVDEDLSQHANFPRSARFNQQQ